MERLDPNDEPARIFMVAPKAWLKLVDDWRREQPENPNRSVAIRQMVEMAAKQAKPKRRRK